MDQRIARAQLLLNQHRPAEARAELLRILSGEPDSFLAHALIALTHLEQDQTEEALEHAQRAVASGPNEPFGHYVLGRAHIARKKYAEAEKAAGEALALDPNSAALYGLLSQVRLCREQWQAGLEAAEEGLRHDPADEVCRNLRSMALTHLRRHDDAAANVAESLRNNPQDAMAHANIGWSYLHRGKAQDAEQHFREALRLRPDLEWARRGVIEALKARNPVYRQILRALLFLGSLPAGQQIVLIIGGFLAYRGVIAVSRQQPGLAPYLAPLLWLYIGFVFVTWASRPLTNAFLFLHPFGRLALTKRERWASTVVVALLCTAAALMGIALSASLPGLVYFASVFFVLVIPAAVAFDVESRDARRWVLAFIAVVAISGLSWPFFIAGAGGPELVNVGKALAAVYGFTLLIWFWGAGQFLARR